MVNHFSSGGIVYKIKDSEPYFLLLNEIEQGWVIPKGHIKASETPEKTAKREISEEADIDINALNIKTKLGKIKYSFNKDGIENQKIVHIYLVEDTSVKAPKPLKTEDFLSVDYFDKEEALKLIAHKNIKEFIKKAWKYLKKK